MDIETEKIYRDAIAKYGAASQLEMMVEECSEVIQAIQKIKRSNYTQDVTKIEQANLHLYEELADLTIVLEQVSLIFDIELINKFKAEKLERLKNRISGI